MAGLMCLILAAIVNFLVVSGELVPHPFLGIEVDIRTSSTFHTP